MKHLCLWLLFVCFSLGALAQNSLKFKVLSKSEGLSQASVFAITQDELGFMWFGTRDGLNRWDGNEFRVFNHKKNEQGLAGNDVRSLYADSLRNGLWIGTQEGVSFFDFNSEEFSTYKHDLSDPNSISGNFIRFIQRDASNRLWIGTSTGLNLMDEQTNTFTRFFDESQKNSNNQTRDITSFSQISNDEFIIGTNKGIYRVSSDVSFTKVTSNPILESIDVSSLQYDTKKYMWIGTSNDGVIRWNLATNELQKYEQNNNRKNSLSNNNIRTICMDEKDQIWIGTFNGLNKYEPENNGFISYVSSSELQHGLSDESVKSIFCDNKGNLWIGTYYGGVNYLDDSYNQFQNYVYSPYKNGLSASVVSSFDEDEKGNLYIGTEGGGLNFMNSTNEEFFRYDWSENSNKISGNNIKSLLKDDDYIWIGLFNQGLKKMNLRTNQIERVVHDPQTPNTLANNNVYALFRKGDYLWIGTYGGGLDIMNVKTKAIQNYQSVADNSQSISSDLTRVIYEMSDKSIWIGTEQGLNQVKLGADSLPTAFTTILPKEKIYALQELSDNKLWIGTISNGLFVYDLEIGEMNNLTIQDGLPGNTIYGILEDQNNMVWISTDNGLSRYDRTDKSFTNYNQNNGLSNSEFNFNAYYKMKNGDLVFGGLNGFTRFNPSEIKPNYFIPNIVLTSLSHNNSLVHINEEGILKESLNTTDKLVFDYNKANFSIGFAALDFSSPDQNRFAYMLEGLDNEWNYVVGNSSANYTIQRNGSYTFRLRGANSDGSWNPTEKTLEIYVNPPLWRTWWAYLIYLILIGLALFGLYRYLRLKNELKLEAYEREQQSVLHEMKLRFFTNITHEFRTPLTLIMGPLSELKESNPKTSESYRKLTMMERNTQRLLNLVNQILTFRKLATDHDPVIPVQADIVHFVEEVFLPFTDSAKAKGIDFKFVSTEESIDVWFDQEKMEKVFFNLLSNAMKFTPQGGEITVKVEKIDSEVIIKVYDSGVGIDPKNHDQIFKRFYEKAHPQNSTIKGSGIGLAISKQMVELHHGQIDVESEVGKGACFIVKLPLGNQHFDTINSPSFIQNRLDKSTESIQDFEDKSTLTLAGNDGETADKKDKDTILIVEDNSEVRDYIVHIFKEIYNIITAENGAVGLKKAKMHNPTLILSDVMMPVMDGVKMCKELKEDLEISHIPVILLTARTATMFKIEGLKIGADDYVTKPFDPEELRLRVQNLIHYRKETREKLSQVLTLDPKLLDITTADEEFLINAKNILEKEIDNIEFTVEQFASQLNVSRALLFTKIKSLTDQTPNNFIKSFRLKRAAQLLIEGKMYVSEVAYKVGFKDPKYFSKCFQREFGETPTNFVEKSGNVGSEV